jgi:hypothetical protein
MPKNAIDYSKTIIYRIVCKDVNITECYVGQTTNFTKRKQQHKENCNGEKYRDYNIYVYQFIRDNMGWDNWDMIEIEKYNAVDSNDASKRERYWIEFYKASLNKQIPSRTKQEHYKDNKDYFLKYQKEYYEENKEIISEYQKQYIEKNKEILAEQKKEYYEKNKQQIIEQRKEKVTCECGYIITKYNLPKHKKTQKHLDMMTRL